MRIENWSLAVLASSLVLSACNDRLVEPSADQPTAGEELGKGSKDARQGKIVFQSNRDGRLELYVMSGTGAGQTRITTSDASELMPAWSPDQTKIVFARFPFRGIESDLYIMNADGTGLRQFTAGPASDWYPDWSPDGSRIAFEREGVIVIVNADGTNETILPNSPDYYDSEPDWSPDGTRLTFSRDRLIDGAFSLHPEVWVMNAAGTDRVQISNSGAAPVWSPDGKTIAFHSQRTGVDQIYVMRPDGSKPTALTSGTAPNRWPIWSLDGKKIAFTGERDQERDIYVMNAKGRRLSRLTTAPGFDDRPAWAP